MKNKITPTQVELRMREDDFIVSKTDLKGRITYGNRIFIEFSGFSEQELLGSQHNIVRHPDMPRGVFKLLWDTIQEGKECFAYVKNMSSNGSFYWVLANVTPSFDLAGQPIGYLSVRRKPKADAVATISGIYRTMLDIETKASPKEAPKASLKYLDDLLAEHNVSYEKFVFTL